jgi:hypothetical protein
MTRISLIAMLVAVLAGCTWMGGRFAPGGPKAAALYTDCATAAVVGLRWQAPRGRVAQYEIMRDGAPLATTTETVFADTTVSESTHYSYSVVAAPRSGAPPAIIGTAQVDTPAASPTGDAPYCRSKHIESISWDWAGGHTEPNGSDLWPVTWGKDGRVYTFFGIAMLASPPPLNAESARNVFGGYNSPHPSTLHGKGGALIAVGRDFYTLGGVYTEAEATSRATVSGSPKRRQLAYSKGNAHSWRAAPWFFCSGEDNKLEGNFCPMGFINFGPGNSGAPDRQVYLFGTNNTPAYWSAAQPASAASTYLARVPAGRLLEKDAYRYFAGLDARGRPVWSAAQQQMRAIFTDRNASRPGCGGTCDLTSRLVEAVYNKGLRRYIGTAQGEYVGQTSFYEAPQPWGPWATISYNNIDAATGTGGWANLGAAGGESLGVHLVNAWTSRDGRTLWATYSSDGTAPPGALFPPEGTLLDSFNLIRVHLNITPASGR